MELVVQLHIFKNSYFSVLQIKNFKEISYEGTKHIMCSFLGLIINRPIFFLLSDFWVLLLCEEINQIGFLFVY